MSAEHTFKAYGHKGMLHCSLHGNVTSLIYDNEIPKCAEAHRNAGCPLALTWKSRNEGGYRG